MSFHQLYTVCESANSRFVAMLECDAGYEQHLTKQNDPSELLELQSSLSREIENEILHMNDSKEINEIESEIAANAAVKELERIGSSENISLVGEVIEPMEVVSSTVTSKNGLSKGVGRGTKPPKNKSPNKPKKSGNDAKTTVCSAKAKAKKTIDNGVAKPKNTKEKTNKAKSPNSARKSKSTEALKENGCHRVSVTTNDKVNFVY